MAPDDRPYTLYRARPRSPLARLRGEDEGFGELRDRDRDGRPGGAGEGGGISGRRVAKWVALAIVGWLALSLLIFLFSAQVQRGKVSDRTKNALQGGGIPLLSKQTILVLGSDQRPKNSKEPGAHSGPSRADTILLIRAGAGSGERLAIPRDTVVDIPGHGRNKINASYAFGGPALTIKTVEGFLGVRVDHLVEVSFTNFPKLIDALGGIDLKTGCIRAEINGGKKNGGTTIRLKKGEHHLNGKTALALSRIRKNDCNPAENDLTRARRQQQIFAAMKGKVTSPFLFFRLPMVAWAAPRALKTDMGGISLLGLFGALATGGSPATHVLTPSGATTLPDGGAGLTVDEGKKAAAVRRFLKG